MDEHKEPVEEYSFLQEVIKDEEKDGKKIRKNISRMVGLGLIFGLAACFAFVAFKPWVEERFFSEPEQITIPEDEEVPEEVPQEETVEPEEPGYQEMLRDLRTVANSSSASVVKISGTVENAAAWSISGVIVADNGQELLILGKQSPEKADAKMSALFVDDTTCEVTLKKHDAKLGLAVYAVTRDQIETGTWARIRKASLGNSNVTAAGDVVIAIGQLAGSDYTVSYGMLNADKTYREYADSVYGELRTDIAGDIGGTGILINIDGDVVGIICQSDDKTDAKQIRAYSISEIKDVIEKLSNGEGIPYVGLWGSDITEDLAEKGFPRGVYVKEIDANSPAMAAGIQSGDILTALNETELTNYTMYHNMLMDMSDGEELHVTGSRQGAGGEYVEIEYTVIVGTR